MLVSRRWLSSTAETPLRPLSALSLLPPAPKTRVDDDCEKTLFPRSQETPITTAPRLSPSYCVISGEVRQQPSTRRLRRTDTCFAFSLVCLLHSARDSLERLLCATHFARDWEAQAPSPSAATSAR